MTSDPDPRDVAELNREGAHIVLPKKKKPPAPKPKERVSRWKNPPWQGIGLHVAWAFTSGQYTPQQLADRIGVSRISWAALEVNPAVENEKYAAAFRDALHAHGKRFAIWERDDAQKTYDGTFVDHAVRLCTTYKPDFYGADVECFPIEEPTFPVEFAKRLPGQPRIAIIPGQPGADQLQAWWDNGWDLMTESYAANIGKSPVPGIAGACDHDAFWRNCPRNFVPTPKGWGSEWWQHGSGPHSVPIIEVNGEGNPSLAAQLESDAVKWFGGNYSIWDAEQMADEDWAVLSA